MSDNSNNMRKITKELALFALILLISPLVSLANVGPISLKASLDSAHIIMGKQTTLHIEIVDNNGVNGALPILDADTIIAEIEVISKSQADTIDLENNRRQINQDIIIQSFDSGLYTIPPIQYIVGKDTFKANPLALKVIPVSVDSLQTIHGQADVIYPNSRWYDFLPDFITDYWGWILVVIIIILGAIFALLLYKKKLPIALTPTKKEIPPYELAIQLLEKLRDEKLCERGQEKEFYTRLTDILRSYIDSRFGINAMEMTTTQIIESLNNNNETVDSKSYVEQVLEIADFVKFAKVRPLPDDNVKSYNWALQFVKETKPIEETVNTIDNSENTK